MFVHVFTTVNPYSLGVANKIIKNPQRWDESLDYCRRYNQKNLSLNWKLHNSPEDSQLNLADPLYNTLECIETKSGRCNNFKGLPFSQQKKSKTNSKWPPGSLYKKKINFVVHSILMTHLKDICKLKNFSK